jgi:dihydrofolate synthase / folylpolyglutamate synthase
MRYPEAVEYIQNTQYTNTSNLRKTKKNRKSSLRRTGDILNKIGRPDRDIPHYIHITGTSGKGSTCLLTYHILLASGLKTGITVSPHPTTIRERFQADGAIMTEDEFVKIVINLIPILERYSVDNPGDAPTFFEVMTIIAFIFFKKRGVEYAIIEVGCGGRDDSTNIIEYKDIAIITNIGLDHADILGGTLETIAREKSGIMMSGVPMFSTERDRAIRSIITDEARKLGTKANFLSEDHTITDSSLLGTDFIYRNNKFHLPVIGEHQVMNAILAIEIGLNYNIDTIDIQRGLGEVILPTRLEVISSDPLTILDSAHNEDELESTIRTIHRLRGESKLHIIVGFTEKPHVRKLLQMIVESSPTSITTTAHEHNPFRKPSDPETLKEILKKLTKSIPIHTYQKPANALTHCLKSVKKDDIILITGSCFLSGELRGYL